MKHILHKILNERIPDSEIIQNIKRKDSEYTYLLHAINKKREKLIEYLLTDPDININRIYSDITPHASAFHWACMSNIRILKLFLGRKELDMNTTSLESTGLHWACGANKIRIVKELLLDARINISVRNIWEQTALDIAIRQEHHRIANMLKKVQYTSLIRIKNNLLCHDIIRMIICEYM